MDIFTWTVIVTVVLSFICALGAILSHVRGRGPRALLRWAGAGLVPIGLLITGAMRPLVEGAQAVGRYFQTATMSMAMIIGLSIIAVAVLTFIAGGRMTPRTREQAKSVRQARRGGQAGAGQAGATSAGAAGQVTSGRNRPPASVEPATRTTSAKPAASSPAPVDDDMAEIEALLKKRGIE